MRMTIALFALTALAACATTTPPDDGARVPTVGNTAPQQNMTARGGSARKSDATSTAQARAADTTAKDQPARAGNSAAISDTQNFAAVTARVTPEQDAARLEALRKQYKFIDPSQVTLPTQKSDVNVVKYALETTNKVGEKIYSRFNPLGAITSQACRAYSVPDEAQAAFLRAGGPRRDPLGLDPDGDGFACDWSPEFYRKLVKK